MGDEQQELSEYLKNHGLSDPKWISLFIKENITRPDHILVLKGSSEKYKVFSPHANEDELRALQHLFEVDIDETQDTQSSGLQMKFTHVGLDSDYWLPIFSKQLGVTSTLALEYLGDESLSALERFVRYTWEEKALRKLLGIEEGESAPKTRHAKQREKLKQRTEKAEQVLKELKLLQEKGKDRHDKAVQQCENNIREMLQISPSTWISKDTSLETVISQLQSMNDKISGTLQARDELSDAQVVQNASGGLALRGIMLTKDISDQLKLRSNLIRPPVEIRLLGPTHPQEDKIEQFVMKTQEDTFLATVDKLGYSVTASAKGGFWGFCFEVSGSYSKTEEEEHKSEEHTQELYSSTVKFSFMPLASYSFGDHDLHLSNEAMKELKSIEMLILTQGAKNSALQSECEKFFRRFGSHANRGPMNFGGIYWWKCSSKGFKRSEMNTVKSLQRETITTHVDLSYGSFGASTDFDLSRLAGKFQGKYAETLISQTFLEVTKTGGPPEASSLPEWKTGLVASNSTWSLVDRGTDLVPVWRIIEMNHAEDFQKTTDLVNALKKAWEVLSCVNDTKQEITASHMLTEVLEAVKTWNEGKDLSKLKTLLDFLLSIKWELIEKTLDPHIWSTLYLSQPPIQQFLKAVIDSENRDSYTSSGYIKVLMQQLVQRMDLNAMTLRAFPEKRYVSQWLYNTEQQLSVSMECQDFESFCEYVSIAIKNMNVSKVESEVRFGTSAVFIPRHIVIEVTTFIAKAFYLLQCNLLKSGQKYEGLFLATLVYPFKHKASDLTLKLLSLQDLECIQRQLSIKSKEFFSIIEDGKASAQAYLFLMTIDTYGNESEVDISELHVCQHLQYLKQELGTEIDKAISDLLIKHHLTNGYDWEKLQQGLEPLAKGLQTVEDHSGRSLQDVMQEYEQHSSSPPKVDHQKDCIPTGNSKANSLFTMLDLLKYYPQKLSLQDALVIRQETLEAGQCSNPSQLYLFILHKVMTYDYKSRNVLLKVQDGQESKTSKSKNTPDLSEISDSEEDSDDSDSSSDTDSEMESEHVSLVHPMDGLLALLHCADDFLRQDLMSRLVTCQLAIPFILPDPFTQQLILPIRAMKAIVKEWKCTLNGRVEEIECPVVSYPTPIVSFLRFGRQAKSKSNLLNEVISDSHHDHFFHRDCEGGNFKQLLGVGLVELCWYFPAGKASDIFPDAVSFLNLHGDAREQRKQAEFLSQITFMSFVLLTEEDLDDKSTEVLEKLSTSPGGFVLLLCASNADKALKQQRMAKLKQSMPDKVHSIKLAKKNADEIKKEVRRRINKRLQDKWSKSKERMTLGECTNVGSKHGFYSDEDNEQFIRGQALACNLQKVLSDFVHKNRKLSAKETMLPLQGATFWQKWAEKDKEEHRHLHRGIERIDVYISKKQEEKAVIRRRQFEHNLSPLMESFILSLLDTEGVRRHFLQCFKYYLDNLSRKNITQLQHKYQENKLKLIQLQQNKEPNQRAVKECKKEIDELHQKIIEASFGLEHLLRELSQVYEAAALSTSLQKGTDIEHLPQIAAELLADGYPLELMDGDAAHVPITWVTAVLKQAVKLLNDPQVFVLSVLGLQSTGKSTLMNSAFGLQFNVSAGRCTRGAFMQLLPISDTLKAETNCDYVLVVDTEGLRAPELDSLKTQQHDNELATFVIGLANVTMINIKGETPGDMDDILQTAVHAFLRMKTVKLNPSCQFIHQNVGAVTASSKGGMGRTRFKQKLDDMTHAAAEEEKCGEQFENFSDVIQFDEEKDVHYFPSLWKGDPPMAPVNDGYSEQAQGLKRHLVKVMKSTSGMYLSQFEVRLSDLWNALLHEKFVFSFKNTLEIRAYNTLDAEYGQWAWALQSKVLKWEQEAETEMVNTKTDRKKFKELYKKLVAKAAEFVEQEHGLIRKKMKEYFENSKEREMLAQWQRETELRLQGLVKELTENAVSHCTQIMTNAQDFAKVDEVKVTYRTQLMTKVKQLVPSSEKGKRLSEDELKVKFNEQWIEWIQELKTNFSQDKEVDIIASVEHKLKEMFRSEEQTVIMKLKQKGLKEWGKYQRLIVKKELHVKPSKSMYHRFRKFIGAPPTLDESQMKRAQDITDDGFAKVKDYLDGKKAEKFNPTFTTEVLRIILKFLDSEDTRHRSEDLHFEREYRIDLSLTACGYAMKQFEKMNDDFKKKTDPIQYLEQEMKDPLLQYFTNKYLQIAKEKAAASQFCRLLSKPLEKQVVDSLPEMIVSDMKTHNTFLNSKPTLIATLLIDLGENLHKYGDFRAVTDYVSNPKASLEQWIKQFTIKHCDGGSGQKRIVSLAKQKLQHLVTLVSDTVEEVTTMKLQGSSQTWLAMFFENEELKKKLKLDRMALEDLGGGINELEDIKGFREELLDGIKKVDIDVTSLLEKLDSTNMDTWTIKPYDLLFERLHGCCELCPFCKEQCTDTNEKHSSNHSVPVHRPQCVGGYRWEGSDEMIYKTCCTLVDEGNASFRNNDTNWKWHPYKDYKQKYGKWSIPTSPRDPSTYWKWFVGNYSGELSRHYGAKADKVDGNWRNIKWSEAQNGLMKDFNL